MLLVKSTFFILIITLANSLSLNKYKIDNTAEVSGFIHNVSLLKNSTYFDLVVQRADNTNKRAICFSPKKHSDLQTTTKASSL